jgi:hypothetical protein
MADKSLLDLEKELKTNQKVWNDEGELIEVKSVYANEEVAQKVASLLKERSKIISSSADDTRDYQWVTVNLFGAGYVLDDDIEDRRFYSSADRKFEDTSLGGNYVCNPFPGFTPYADVPKPGIADRNALNPLSDLSNIGMGCFYSEAFDDTMQVIHVRCGKPEFNSMWGFFRTSYNVEAARLANTGRFTSIATKLGAVGGVAVLAFMFGGMIAFGLLAANYIAGGLHGMLVSNPYKFYSSRPIMSVYWNAVTQMVNQIMTHSGVFPSFEPQDIGKEVVYSKDMHEDLRALMPGVFGKSGFIDIYAVINRAERVAIRVRKAQQQVIDFADSNASLKAYMSLARDEALQADDYNTLEQALKLWQASEIGGTSNKDKKADSIPTLTGGTIEEKYTSQQLEELTKSEDGLSSTNPPAFFDDPGGWISSKLAASKEYLDAEFQDGAAFATFRVDHTGPVQESFTNTTRSNDLGQKINSMSAQGRAVSFSFAQGNLVPGMDEVLSGIKGFAAGALDTLNLGGLLSLAGSAYTDIPEGWENAVANLPSMSYSVRLQAPHAHPISRLQFEIIPLCMFLGLALPHAAGRASYTQPFLCEVYDPGKAISRMCIVQSLQITRGVANLGFTKNKHFRGVDINISFKDLSSIMYMPLDTSFSIDPFKHINSHDSTYSDYLSVLGASKLGSQIYRGQKLKLRAKNWVRGNIQSLSSPSQWAGIIRDMDGINLLDLMYTGSTRGN